MSTTTKIKVELYPRQWDFMATSDRLAAFVGGIGSGKTYVGAVRSLLFAIEQGGLGMVVAPTYPMLRDATLRTLIDIAEALRIPVKTNEAKMTMQVQSGARGSILLRSSSVDGRRPDVSSNGMPNSPGRPPG